MNSGDKSNTSKNTPPVIRILWKGMRRCFREADKDVEELVGVIQCWVHSCQKHSCVGAEKVTDLEALTRLYKEFSLWKYRVSMKCGKVLCILRSSQCVDTNTS
jgi:hypothetical protein